MVIEATQPNISTIYPTMNIGVSNEALSLKKSLNVFFDTNAISSFLINDRRRFNMLSSTWEKETLLTSSSNEMFSNQSYLEIIGMGKKALPYLLDELREKPDHWFVALKSITGIDPVPPQHRGNINKMAEDWLSWADENRYI